MKKINVRYLTETAIMVALSTVLSLLPIWKAPFGGTVTFASSLPILVIAFRYGFKKGLLAAFVASALQIVLGLDNFAYVPSAIGIVLVILFDYVIAFGVYGFVGLFRKLGKNSDSRKQNMINFGLGSFIVMTVRFICHWISGAIIWYSLTKGWYPDDPGHIVNKYGPWVYSFIYNITYMLPETILTVVLGISLAYFINLKREKLSYKL